MQLLIMKRICVFIFLLVLDDAFGFLENVLPAESITPPWENRISTKTAVPICSESRNKLQNLLAGVVNNTVFELKRPSEQFLAVCKNTFTENFENKNENEECFSGKFSNKCWKNVIGLTYNFQFFRDLRFIICGSD